MINLSAITRMQEIIEKFTELDSDSQEYLLKLLQNLGLYQPEAVQLSRRDPKPVMRQTAGRKQAQLGEEASGLREKILCTLRSTKGPRFASDIYAEIGGKRTSLNSKLGLMAREGEIVRVSPGCYKLPQGGPLLENKGQLDYATSQL